MFSFRFKKEKKDAHTYTVINFGFSSVSVGVFAIDNSRPVIVYQNQKFFSGVSFDNNQKFILLVSLLENILHTMPVKYRGIKTFFCYDSCWVFSSVYTFFTESQISKNFSLKNIEKKMFDSAQADIYNFFSKNNDEKKDFNILEKKISGIEIDEVFFTYISKDIFTAKVVHASYFISAVDSYLHNILIKKLQKHYPRNNVTFITQSLSLYSVAREVLELQGFSDNSYSVINVSEGSTSVFFNANNILLRFLSFDKGLESFLNSFTDKKIGLSEIRLISSRKILFQSNYSTHAELQLASQIWFDGLMRHVSFLKNNLGTPSKYVLFSSLDTQDWFRYIMDSYDSDGSFFNTSNSRVILINRKTISGLVLSKIENPAIELLCLGLYCKLLVFYNSK